MTPNSIHTASPLFEINWAPGIGDPTIVGWLTVLAYFIAVFLCVACAKRKRYEISDKNLAAQRRLWWFIALALFLLGINKQLDLQTFLTEAGRMIARREGWYEQRRWIQELFVASVFCGSFFLLVILFFAFRDIWKENRLTIAGLVFLVGFVVIRATSFHHVDLILGWHFGNFKLNWILELDGIACILISAAIHLKRSAKSTGRAVNRIDVFI